MPVRIRVVEVFLLQRVAHHQALAAIGERGHQTPLEIGPLRQAARFRRGSGGRRPRPPPGATRHRGRAPAAGARGTSLPSPTAARTSRRTGRRRRRADRRPAPPRDDRPRCRPRCPSRARTIASASGPLAPTFDGRRRSGPAADSAPWPPRCGRDGAGSRRDRASPDRDEKRSRRLFARASAARMPRAAAQRSSADAKRADAGLKERTRNDPSDFTDFTCSGTGPAKVGHAPT